MEPIPPRPDHGAALTELDLDPDDHPDMIERDLPDPLYGDL